MQRRFRHYQYYYSSRAGDVPMSLIGFWERALYAGHTGSLG
ncbi:hypothetical protein [Carnimonas bestiolae]